MSNGFDIDSSADTHLLNETFHIFSKSPGSPTTTLAGARLKSGHTTTATDVWADEIPAFFNAVTQTKFELFEKKAVKDDLCLFNGNVFQHNGTLFVKLGSTDDVLFDGATFSKNNKDVVKYHKKRTAINLTADNNNGDGSNNFAAKIYNAASDSTTFVPQFISSTDKVVDGIPSLAYNAVVSDNTGVLLEGLTADNDYICNSYAGVIQFNKQREGTVTVSAWEYIGDRLSKTITDISETITDLEADFEDNKKKWDDNEEELLKLEKAVEVNSDKLSTAISSVSLTTDYDTLIDISSTNGEDGNGLKTLEITLNPLTGEVSENNEGLVTGKTVASAINDAVSDLEESIAEIRSISDDTYTADEIDSRFFETDATLDDHLNNNNIHNSAVLNNLYDKSDNIKSYNEGTITFVDENGAETIETLDLNGTMLAQGTFRTTSGKTSVLISFNERPELIDEEGKTTSNKWYDDNYASLFDYEMDANAHSVAQNESSSLGSLINGSWMFVRSGLTMFNDDLNCLMNGTGMFYNSASLNRFKSALPSLTVGQWMFKDCVSLKEFRVKLPALSIAQGMFAYDSGLTSFRSAMPNLTVAIDMFLNCTSLKSFIVPPSSLSNLYYARCMFYGCPLEDFTGSLEAIEQPQHMFYGCKLTEASLNRIADTVKDCKDSYEEDNRVTTFGTIGINCTESKYKSSEFEKAIKKIEGKGWTCSVAFNGEEVSSIGEDDITPVKLIYVQKENLGDSINDYIDADDNKWTLIIAHKVSDPENWNIFSDEAEAAEAFGLTKI